jgi:hypothetical protein
LRQAKAFDPGFEIKLPLNIIFCEWVLKPIGHADPNQVDFGVINPGQAK